MGFALRPLVYNITYDDGRTETVTASMRARIQVERTWPEGSTVDEHGKLQLRQPAPGIEATMLVAWWSLQDPAEVEAMKPPARQKAMDEWMSTVVAIEEPDEAPADPSRPAVTDG